MFFRKLYSRGKWPQVKAENKFDKLADAARIEIGEQVFLWSVNLSKKVEKKAVKLRTGLFAVKARPRRHQYMLELEKSAEMIHAHAN